MLRGFGDRGLLQFRESGESIAVSVSRGIHLYLAQTLDADANEEEKSYRLRTLAYSYRISDGPNRTDTWLIRWEYNSRDLAEHAETLHPRHHCHINTELSFCNRPCDLVGLHIATGWVTIEEVIRFLIKELEVKPKSQNWDVLLQQSEEKFREWTARNV